jgi:hypothetical protein
MKRSRKKAFHKTKYQTRPQSLYPYTIYRSVPKVDARKGKREGEGKNNDWQITLLQRQNGGQFYNKT